MPTYKFSCVDRGASEATINNRLTKALTFRLLLTISTSVMSGGMDGGNVIHVRRSTMLKHYIAAREKLVSLRKDIEGASLIEYSLLIGLISVGVVVTIGLVGTWVGTQWTALNGAVTP